jgi:hypothetical protein
MLARALIWGAILTVIVYDVIARSLDAHTISDNLRLIDRESHTLLRWLLLGVWMHLYCPQWYTYPE